MGLGKMMETGDLLIELRMRQADDVVAILTIMETGDLHVDLDDIAIIHKEHEIYGIVPRHNGWITIRKDNNGKYNYDLFIAPSY